MKMLFFILFFCFAFSNAVHAAPDSWPRLANYFLKWQLTESEARELAKWDVVVLDMETQITSPALLKKLREWNPDIILLAYVTAQEIRQDAVTGASVMRRRLAERIQPDWYLTDARGRRLTWWPGTYLLNVSDAAPTIQGKKMNKAMAEFAAEELLRSGFWDGVFYDNAWDSITAFVPGGVDVDRNGSIDADADARWQAGMRYLYDETRRLAGKPIILVGNGTTRAYRNQLNGNLIENFIAPAWTPTMRTYAYNAERLYAPVVNIVNANTGNAGNAKNFAAMRFGLASTLMGDGYYSFDFGDRDHGQLWWYDEYAVDLGRPEAPATAVGGAKDFHPDVWQRPFEHGLALVNATQRPSTVELPGEYEKIRGEDARVNDGAIVSRVTLSGFDGLIVLKSFSSIFDVPYPNGAFVRFFHADGTRARNGFFAFDSGAEGGEAIARIDLDGNGKRDFVRAVKNKLIGTRDDGQPLFRLYPYTANFSGSLSLAFGANLVAVAPAAGGREPIRLYTPFGERIGGDWLPLGNTPAESYAVRIGDVSGVDSAAMVVVVNTAQGSTIRVYDAERRFVRQWQAFRGGGKTFIALGDTSGDGENEIIAASIRDQEISVKLFDARGRAVGAFAVPTSPTGSLTGIAAQDVDFDGAAEIVVFAG